MTRFANFVFRGERQLVSKQARIYNFSFICTVICPLFKTKYCSELLSRRIRTGGVTFHVNPSAYVRAERLVMEQRDVCSSSNI